EVCTASAEDCTSTVSTSVPNSSLTFTVVGWPISTRLLRELNLRKPLASTSIWYVPVCTASKAYAPDAVVLASKVCRVPSLINFTAASGTTAPLASCTVPRTREVVPWPNTVAQAHTRNTRKKKTLFSPKGGKKNTLKDRHKKGGG